MPESSTQNKYLISHGTTWKSQILAISILACFSKNSSCRGIQVKLPWGNELKQAEKVALVYLILVYCLNFSKRYGTGNISIYSSNRCGYRFYALAAALVSPLLNYLGQLTLKSWRIGQKHIIVTSEQTLKCMPCWKRKCTHKDADTYATCMHGITPARYGNCCKRIVIYIKLVPQYPLIIIFNELFCYTQHSTAGS